MAASDPTFGVPTPTGTLQGVAAFSWDGAAWQPAGRAGPSVATPTGVLQGVAAFNGGPSWQPSGQAGPGVATPTGVLDGVAVYTWSGSAWTPPGGTPTPSTPSGSLQGVAAFNWDGTAWQPAGQAGPDVSTPYGVLTGVAMFNWTGTAWAAVQGPSLDLSFMNPGTLDPRINFSRASSGTYFDSSGVMRTAAINLALWSADYTNAVWNKLQTTVTSNAALAPDGTMTASKLVETAVSNTHYMIQARTGSNETLTLSCYLRAGERSSCSLQFSNQATAVARVFFDLTAGTIFATDGPNADYTSISGTIQRVGASSWFRCTLTVTKAAVNTTNAPAVGLYNASSTYLGDGTSGIYVWGVQLEVGTSASAYVPTTSVANGAPRWDYDPVTLALRGLLIEEARTNIWLQSADASNAAWAKAGGVVAAPTVTGNQTAAPDGTTTAARIVYPAVSGAGAYSTVNQNLITTANPSMFSVWLRGNVGGEQLYLNCTPDAVTWYRQAVTLTTAWQRFVLTMPAAPGGYYFQIGTDLRDAGQTSKPAQTIYAWGGQVELGAFATSYIPTTAAAVTRAQEQAILATTGWMVAPGGSWFGEFIFLAPSALNARIVGSLGAGTPTPLFIANTLALATIDTIALTTTNPITVGAINKGASNYNAGTGSVCLNGGPVATGTQGAGFSPTQVAIFQNVVGPSNNNTTGYIRRVRYWPRALSNAELQSVTQ